MASSTIFRTVELEGGTFAVVRSDAAKPLVMEVVATFYDAARAHDYAAKENSHPSREVLTTAPKAAKATPKAPVKSARKPAPRTKAEQKKTEPESATAASSDLTGRQSAVLKALRSKTDADNSVEAKAAVLADAAGIPLGSLHSILQSLEKKELIRTTRAGSPKAPAVYQVL